MPLLLSKGSRLSTLTTTSATSDIRELILSQRFCPILHRPLSAEETARRQRVERFLDEGSEDDIINDVLLPLFRHLGFRRVTATGHEDKFLEYGKDIWMKYALPTLHVLYFGIQVKKGTLDASGRSDAKNVNIAEVHNQVAMMVGHEIFDPEIGKQVLVDHAFIVAGGTITKAAKNWLGGRLDASKRSQILFMDREDILNLFAVTSTPLPGDNARDRWLLDPGAPF
jgi:hypothetical protein